MVFGRLWGKTIVDTQYSFAEIVRRLHTSIEYLNKYISEHDANPNPVQRAAILGRILFQMFRFNILSKKLVMAYLKLARSNIDNVSAYFANNPQPQDVMDKTDRQIRENLQGVVKDQSRERDKSHYLRLFANSLIYKGESSAKQTKKAIKAKIAQIAQLKRQVGAQQKAAAAKQQKGKAQPPQRMRPALGFR